MTPVPDPDHAQRRAADRDSSVWVAASAGTGKTTVLTNRVLNLLLGGAEPQRLLCLTFTKAAAAEMSNRINKRLSEWAVCPHTDLRDSIMRITGSPPEEEICNAARRLFARVLDTPGGMQIMTIHAFCQSVLRRFPLEAGVPPNFDLMDDRSAAELMREGLNAILAEARQSGEAVFAPPPLAGGGWEEGVPRQRFSNSVSTPSSNLLPRGEEASKRPIALPAEGLTTAVSAITQRLDEARFGDLITALCGERGRIEELVAAAGGIAPYIQKIWLALGFDGPISEADLLGTFVRETAFDAEGLRRCARRMLASGKQTDLKHGQIIAGWLAENEAGRLDLWDGYLAVFFTGEGKRRRDIATRSLVTNEPWMADILAAEGDRLEVAHERRAAVNLAHATAALSQLSHRFFRRLAAEKRRRALIDYDDLILATRDLLRRPGVAPWVLFKLDGGIDHILLDEAQDTNPEQWQIVQILANEFFAGIGAKPEPRTIFAVGDAKQSIFSFQRADPLKFIAMRQYFAEKARDAKQGFREVPLEKSFRSTRAVLDLVDKVFESADSADGVLLDGVPIRHDADRTGMAGRVELWPLLAPLEQDDEAPWQLPVHQVMDEHPRTRLAGLVAAQVERWIAEREVLPARGRPVAPRDVLVLVRRRNAFVHELIRALKQRGVPVAGADRIVLNRQIAVMDLMALGQFLVLPEDDLNLATLLKTPLFGFDDDRLLPLAHERPSTLWASLRQAARRGDAVCADTVETLDGLLARADFVAPYELYADVLGVRGGRRKLIQRLGHEAGDAIDEFLSQTLVYERDHVPSLQGFLHWMGSGETEVKRDPESGERDEVRIMTVHGAKGLQAPIVIMPDTVAVPDKLPPLRWLESHGIMLWIPKDGADAALAKEATAAAKLARDREYRRLLYVALTRAEDRLYVCGWQTSRQPADHSWYQMIERAMLGCDAEPIKVPNGFSPFHRDGQVIDHPQNGAAKPDNRRPVDERGDTEAPEWLRRLPPKEPSPPRPLLASRPSQLEPAARSPLMAKTDERRYQRGLIIHRLLQTLPELPPGNRSAAARRYLGDTALALDPAEQAAILGETLAVLENPEWTALFGPKSQAEVPVVGLIGDNALSGRIDRLVVTGTEVLIVDYKTNRPPPKTLAEVPAAYIEQMAAYRAALERIYPERRIRTVLLWTDELKLMEVFGLATTPPPPNLLPRGEEERPSPPKSLLPSREEVGGGGARDY